ncbi:MAG: hypothetical protein J6J07_03585, partial [Oscillospiraceae bacterium]|nr:hypothetical protein [Oscillospiraceae bacterium]
HEAALARGVKVTGATVHFVDAGMDTGPIILQKAVYVEKGDNPEGNFQPMGANMGLLPPLPTKIRHKDERYQAVAERAVAALEAIL